MSGNVVRYKLREFRSAAGLNLDHGWQQKRYREIASLHATEDVWGNTIHIGDVARLLGTGSGHPENNKLPLCSYVYTAMEAGEPSSTDQSSSSSNNFAGYWKYDPTAIPDLLDSELGQMPGGPSLPGSEGRAVANEPDQGRFKRSERGLQRRWSCD